MIWRNTIRAGGAALAVAALASASPASAQIERVLAGIRLNTSSRNVISRYGNPTQVVVGDIPIRLPRQRATAAGGVAGAGAGFGAPGGFPGAGGLESPEGPPAGGFGGGMSPFPVTGGGFPGGGGYPGGGFGGPPAGGLEAPGGFPGAPAGGFGGYPGAPGGGMEAPGGGFGGGAAGGAFGNTTSTLARQQEVTWIYDRPGGISYEFLIGADGRVIQIRAIGYKGGNVKTSKGIQLGSSYATVVQRYGYPEEHMNVGPILVASYRNRAHSQFQFLNNKVIAVTIASVE